LRRFCAAVLDLLRPGALSETATAQVAQRLAGAISSAGEATVAQLRHEIQGWDSAAAQLRQLASSSFVQFGDEASALLAKLEHARAQALRVVEALEGLHATPTTGSSTAAESAPSPPAADAGKEGKPSPQTAAIALLAQAEACRQEGRLAAAVEFYGRALELDADLRTAYLNRGRVHVLQGRTHEGICDLTRALDLEEHDFQAYWWRGDAQTICGRHFAAIADYTRALELRPDLFVVRYNRAVAYRQGEEYSRALAELDELVQLKPAHGALYLNRGLIHLARGELARAADEFRAALRRQPDSQEARQRLQETEARLRQQPVQRVAARARQALADSAAADTPAPQPAESPARPAAAIEADDVEAAIAAVLAEPAPAAAAPPEAPRDEPKPAAGPAGSHSFPFECPGCDAVNMVRWEKLQLGKVLTCPHCHRHFTVKSNGRFAEVVREKSGRWTEQEQLESAARQRRARRLRWLAGTVAAVLLFSTISWAPQALRQQTVAEPELPRELEPRAELFTRAWLSGDSRTMRRLTDPVQDRLLFTWSRRNPPPSSIAIVGPEDEVQVAVEVLPSVPPTTWLRVRVDGLPKSDGKPEELQLAWEHRGGQWIFQPAPAPQSRL
jgi:tetratricopeptide (TPR) repeat protein